MSRPALPVKMNVVADIGNTLVKLALFDGDRLADRCVFERFTREEADALFSRWRNVRRILVAATGADGRDVAALLRGRADSLMEFRPAMATPLGNAYLTPETLGCDRLAAAVGAAVLYPGRNTLIVDFGTAVTIDLVTADGTYRGGFISPGLQSRFRALHDYTAGLPLCGPTDEELPLGRTTRTCIEQGVIRSLCYEIAGHIDRMRAGYDGLLVIFTGGDAKFFEKRFKYTIFANCDLVFHGLNRILEYHACEENPR